MKLDEGYTNEPYSFLVNDTILSSDNPLRFRKKLLSKWVLVSKSKQSITKLSKQSSIWQTRQKTADLVTFTEQVLNRKFIFCAVNLDR